MHALVIETSPAVAASSLAVAFQIQLAIIREDIVFTRHIKHLARFDATKNLCHRVKFLGRRQVCQIARVQHEGRPLREGVDAVNCLLQRGRHIFVWLLAEADVAVADLHE